MKKILICAALLLLGVVILTSCDPIYPLGKLKAEKIEPLSPGESAEIKLVYPETGGSIVKGWKDRKAEVLEGKDFVEISGLTVTALKPGTAKIRISATTVINEEATEGDGERIYDGVITVQVK